MPYLMQPANYTQTMRPNLYNVAYRRVGAYKGMGRLHPSNYLEIGPRPNLIGGTSGQYNTLSTQLALLPPSLRGVGMLMPPPGSRGVGMIMKGPRRGRGMGLNFAADVPSFSQFTGGPNTSGYSISPSGAIMATQFTPNFSAGGSGYTVDSTGALVATTFAGDVPSTTPFSGGGSSSGGGSAPSQTISGATVLLIAGGILLLVLMSKK